MPGKETPELPGYTRKLSQKWDNFPYEERKVQPPDRGAVTEPGNGVTWAELGAKGGAFPKQGLNDLELI